MKKLFFFTLAILSTFSAALALEPFHITPFTGTNYIRLVESPVDSSNVSMTSTGDRRLVVLETAFRKQ